MKRVCIYGAGAIGGWIGTRLARAGHSVSVVARGATLSALRRHGLRLSEAGQTHALAVAVSDDPAQLGAQDLVVVSVKAPSLRDVAQRIAPLLGRDTMVLPAINGIPWWFFQGFGGALEGRTLQSVDPDGEIARHIEARRVVGCVVHAACSTPEPGLVAHRVGQRLIVGEPAGGAAERVLALSAMLAGAGFEAPLSEQIQRDVWFKLWGNMTMNPVGAITGATIAQTLADPLVREFCSSVMLEARAIGGRIGLPIEQSPEDRHKVTQKLGAFKTSMLQDVEAGRPVELDALLGVMRELGQMTGVPTPSTDALFGLARLHARVRSLYPLAASAA